MTTEIEPTAGIPVGKKERFGGNHAPAALIKDEREYRLLRGGLLMETLASDFNRATHHNLKSECHNGSEIAYHGVTWDMVNQVAVFKQTRNATSAIPFANINPDRLNEIRQIGIELCEKLKAHDQRAYFEAPTPTPQFQK